jgi:hypothetical protein
MSLEDTLTKPLELEPPPRLLPVAALERVRPEFAQLNDRDLISLNIDVVAACSKARAALPRIRTLRDAFEAELKRFDFTLIDKLELYCSAALQANAFYFAMMKEPENVRGLVEEATKLREVLLADVISLAKRGLLDDKPLKKLKGANGALNVASDVLTLAIVLRNDTTSRAAATEAELSHAEFLSDRIVELVGLREKFSRKTDTCSRERQQAFTLFVQTYKQIRRAVMYVRGDIEDVEEFAPSLYSERCKPRKKEPALIESPSVGNPEASSVVASSTAIDANVAKEKKAVGMPGADPFV